MKRILTFGTFDLLHRGHIRLLERAKAHGDYLVVALSTDEFNWREKQKVSYYEYETRKKMLEALHCVDMVIAENDWQQKIGDIQRYDIDAVIMGSDWRGSEEFEHLREFCDVIYLSRTRGVSSTGIKQSIEEMGGGLDG